MESFQNHPPTPVHGRKLSSMKLAPKRLGTALPGATRRPCPFSSSVAGLAVALDSSGRGVWSMNCPKSASAARRARSRVLLPAPPDTRPLNSGTSALPAVFPLSSHLSFKQGSLLPERCSVKTETRRLTPVFSPVQGNQVGSSVSIFCHLAPDQRDPGQQSDVSQSLL